MAQIIILIKVEPDPAISVNGGLSLELVKCYTTTRRQEICLLEGGIEGNGATLWAMNSAMASGKAFCTEEAL